MNHIEAMKQALETLEHIDYEDNDRGFLLPYQCTMLDNAIIAIKQALNDAPHLAAPVQELTNLQRHEQNVRKFLAAQPAPVQEPRPISDFPELQEAVRKGLADGSLTIQGAAPVQEPVARVLTHKEMADAAKRYTTPPAAQRQCENCGEFGICCQQQQVPLMQEGKNFTISKPWVGLTDEEVKKVHTDAGVTYLVPADYDRHLFTHMTDVQIMKVSRAIEAKLREKNGGAA